MVIYLHAVLLWYLARLYWLALWYLLAVLLYQLTRMKKGSTLDYGLLCTSSGPFTNIGSVRLKGLLMFRDMIFILFTSPHFIPRNMCPVRQHRLKGCLTAWNEIPLGLAGLS